MVFISKCQKNFIRMVSKFFLFGNYTSCSVWVAGEVQETINDSQFRFYGKNGGILIN